MQKIIIVIVLILIIAMNTSLAQESLPTPSITVREQVISANSLTIDEVITLFSELNADVVPKKLRER